MAQTSPRRLGPRGIDDVLYPKLGTEILCPSMWPVPVGCVGINQMKPIDFNIMQKRVASLFPRLQKKVLLFACPQSPQTFSRPAASIPSERMRRLSSSKLIRAEPATLIPTLSSEKYGLLAKDRVRVNVPHVNLLVDSLNTYGFGTPSDSDEIEAIEDDEDEPGKILLANDGDIDMDSIPDYADGYDLLAGLPDDDASPGVSFVPVVFEIPEPIDVAEAVVRLSYSASDPGAVTTNGLGGYVLPSGRLRLWAKNGSQQRSTNLVWRILAASPR